MEFRITAQEVRDMTEDQLRYVLLNYCGVETDPTWPKTKLVTIMMRHQV